MKRLDWTVILYMLTDPFILAMLAVLAVGGYVEACR